MQTALVWLHLPVTRDARRRRPHLHRSLCAWALIGAIAALTVLAGIHELDHLQGRLDPRRCAVCQWSYGATASTICAVVALLTLLVLFGPCLTDDGHVAAAPCRRARSSRAPPRLP
jgi:hypothetical protein